MSTDDAMLELVTAQHKMIMSLLDRNEALVKVLEAVNHTLCIHGHIDHDTPLHDRVHDALAKAHGEPTESP